MFDKIAASITAAIPHFLGMLLIFATIESLFAYHKGKKIVRRGFSTDAIYFLFNKTFGILLDSLLIVLTVKAFFSDEKSYYQFLTDSRLDWPLWFQVIASLLILDFVFYWEHYFFHRCKPLWRIHTIHHSSLDLDWLSTYRLHIFEMLVFYVMVPFGLLLLGFAPAAFVAGGLFKRFYNSLLHANVPWTFGWLGFILASPRFHRWHHETASEAAGKNLATMFSFYDWIFGTYYAPRDKLPKQYGVPGEEVPDSFVAQFFYPFLPKSVIRDSRQRQEILKSKIL
jgi:sterol desaturase/sphingolipid hydroxylase (fatty acid hydroxylase superfamily)